MTERARDNFGDIIETPQEYRHRAGISLVIAGGGLTTVGTFCFIGIHWGLYAAACIYLLLGGLVWVYWSMRSPRNNAHFCAGFTCIITAAAAVAERLGNPGDWMSVVFLMLSVATLAAGLRLLYFARHG